jgi:Ca2+-binding EF-hand superfamily protein
MISRRKAIAVWLTTLMAAMTSAHARAKKLSPLERLDTDHDGTVSLDEAKKAAETMFNKLDRDHDGTLTSRELRGRLSAQEFAAADTDKDGTISKDEYLAVVEQRFKAADTDSDGTLTVRELRTRAGRRLLRLLK